MNASTPPTWLHFVRKSGEAGARWAERYHEAGAALRLSEEAVQALRQRRHCEGEALLRRARGELRALDGSTPPSVKAVVERWYYGALGYYFYVLDDFDPADCAMARAHGAVVAAVEREPCLVSLAIDAYEIEMHRARVSRERRAWAQMRERAAGAAAMRAGDRPLCTLADGTEVWLADVQRFYRQIPGLTDEERASLATIVDDAQSRVHAERAFHYVFRVPGAVIQYP